MSGRKAIQLLVDIVAKGGNLLLNIAPSPEGEWQPGAYALLQEFAAWMRVNSEAIYGTRAIAPYKEGNICLTRKKDGSRIYFLYLAAEGETTMPAEITIRLHRPPDGTAVTLLGTQAALQWAPFGKVGFKIFVPETLRENPPAKYVWVFRTESRS